MLATGAEDFSDILVPLLSEPDQQTRLRTYRLWPDISSLGLNWREQVRGWSEAAPAEFVSELFHYRVDGAVAAFAAEDDSIAVKRAAVSGLMWTRSDDALTRVLESMKATRHTIKTIHPPSRHSPGSLPPTPWARSRELGGIAST
jgi:hypothetical protein